MTNTFTENELIHIPVTITPEDISYTYPHSPKTFGKGKEGSWWSKNPFVSYNAMLISAYHGMGRIRDRHQIRDDVLFFGDSGGFQVLQHKLGNLKDPNISTTLTWKKVIEWQLRVCDIAMTLDIPTPRAWMQIKDKKIFEDRLDESTQNAQAMLKYKEDHIGEAYNPDFKLFNCIHGVFYKDMERWNDVTTNDHDFEYDGFSLSTSSIMKYVLALRLGFAMEHSKGKPYHLLGVSSPQPLTLIAHANKYTDTQIYFDSSSASTGRMIRKYMIFWDFSGNGMTLSEKPKYHDFKTLNCPCPVCSRLEKPEDLWNTIEPGNKKEPGNRKSPTRSGILITLHNLYWMTNYTGFVNNFVNCPEDFMIYVRRLTREPPDNPYKPPKDIDKVIAAQIMKMRQENGQMPFDIQSGEIPVSAPVFTDEEILQALEQCDGELRSTESEKGGCTSWILKYMDFLDLVNEEGLEVAWGKYFVGNEKNTDALFENSDEESCAQKEGLYSDQNKNLKTALDWGNAAGEKAVKKKMTQEVLIEEVPVTIKEVVDVLLTGDPIPEATILNKSVRGRKVDEPAKIYAPKVEDMSNWW